MVKVERNDPLITVLDYTIANKSNQLSKMGEYQAYGRLKPAQKLISEFVKAKESYGGRLRPRKEIVS